MPHSPHLFFFLFAVFVVPSTFATDYIVGDESGWTSGVNYSIWTSGKTFFVGDNLIFRYEKRLHNVLKVNGSEFKLCAASSAEPPLQSGNDVISLLRPGKKWYICSIGQHCLFGQHLVITVLARTNNATASAPATSAQSPRPTETAPPSHSPLPEPSHSPLPSATAPPPPPSGAAPKAAVSGRFGSLVVAFAVMIMV